MADFLDLTRRPNMNNISSVSNAQQQQQSQQTNNDKNDLQKTDIFTAEKNGMKPNQAKNSSAAGVDSGMFGKNAFGDDSSIGDTFTFSNKEKEPNAGVTAVTKGNGTVGSLANKDSDIQKLAEELGVKADENAIKTKLKSLDIKALAKVDGEAMDIAQDLGLISKADVDKKMESDKNNKGEKDDKYQIKFGAFTSGSEV